MIALLTIVIAIFIVIEGGAIIIAYFDGGYTDLKMLIYFKIIKNIIMG